MPCAAGSLCILKLDHTPGPLLCTNHKCRVCGSYLHGLCGLPDPEGANEIHRVCHGCVISNNRKESSTDPAAGAASSKRQRPGGQRTGKEKQAGLGLAPGARPTRASMDALETLVGVEEDADVAGAVVADLKDDLCELSLSQLDLEESDDDQADSSAGDKGQCTQPVLSSRPPPYIEVATQFGELEGVAERCGMAEVS